MSNIKLFVSCHQPFDIPQHPLLFPIQVGAALANQRFDGFLYDDIGKNISSKNRSYCELTAQYWAWKNVVADYYGFFHYRRYLYPDTTPKHPYCIKPSPTKELLTQLGYESFAHLIERFDLILPIGENMYLPVREHYANAAQHRRKDLELTEQIIQELHPEMASALVKYLSGPICYFGNIYIMKRQVFYDYCSWLFPILEEFDRRAGTTGYSKQELRVDGYLAERLFGIWLTHVRSELHTLELPRVHFLDGQDAMKKRFINALLPPGSHRRAVFKRLKRS